MIKITIPHENHVIVLGYEDGIFHYKITTDGVHKVSGSMYSGDYDNLWNLEEMILKYTGFKLLLDQTGKGNIKL